MWKRVLKISVLVLVTGYLIVAITAFNRRPSDMVCEKIDLVIRDSVNAGFITSEEVSKIFKKEKLDPIGKQVDEIETAPLEELLNTHPLIENAECYKTPSGALRVEVSQRLPLFRVMSSNGENYYIDNKGKVMPADAQCIAHRVVVTGNVDKVLAMTDLYYFGQFLERSKFWNAQIEQINVTKDKEIELVPRVGEHIIFMGKLDNFEDKLSRLKTFYEKALNQVGWNKYSRISLEFNNQIICTKK